MVAVRTTETDRPLTATGARRVVILGNSGSGKSTLARALAQADELAVLDLDTVAWSKPGVRHELHQSSQAIASFIEAHDEWVIEGCYASLVALALPHCTELVFLDPGVEACLANNRRRPWEPHKYASKAEQDANFEMLQQWVRAYDTRDDEYSRRAHEAVFESFVGTKTLRREPLMPSEGMLEMPTPGIASAG